MASSSSSSMSSPEGGPPTSSPHLKRYCPHMSSSHPSKRKCASNPPSSSSSSSSSPSSPSNICPTSRPTPPIEKILQLEDDAIYTLCKRDLRNHFFALQKYAKAPYPLSLPSTSPHHASQGPTPFEVPPFLRLPLEIREMVYKFLLPPPADLPVKGPHPRQLQNHIHLSQAVPANLLRLNHQIRAEALPTVYGSPDQLVYVKIDYNVWEHKTNRSPLVLQPSLTSCIRRLDLSIHLGSEKRNKRPVGIEAYARLKEAKKGIKKLGKWLAGADIMTVKINWQEPPETFTWEQKKDVLDGIRTLRPVSVVAGEINWGLEWNKGKKYRFETAYFKELERSQQTEEVIEG